MFELLRIATPVSLLYLGIMAMGTVDLMFLGQLGAAELGGAGVANSAFNWFMVAGLGILYGIDYPASFAVGAQDRDRAYRIWVQGIYLSVILAAILMVGMWGTTSLFPVIGINAEVLPHALSFWKITMWGLLPVFLFNVTRSYQQAQLLVMPALWILVIGNVLNYFLDRALILGDFGFPRLGVHGAAIATVISRVFLFAALATHTVWYDRRTIRAIGRVSAAFDQAIQREVLRLGIPSGMQMLAEVGVFSLSTILAARFTADALAAHNLVLTTASNTFMIPLGVGIALSSLIGNAMGEGNHARARKLGQDALIAGWVFMTFTAMAMIIFPRPLLSLFHASESVTDIATMLLWVAGVFQLSDATQTIATGALRGLGESRIPAIANIVGHWLIGLPLGIFLAFHLDLGVRGIWMGLSLGLTVVAVIVWWTWRRRSTQFLQA